jgi:hypothetical protein
MRREGGVTVSALAGCLMLLACSGGGSGGSSFAQDQYANCFNAGAPGDCSGCLDMSCPTELRALEQACSGFLMCACPGGNFDSKAATSPSCDAQLTGSSTCQTAYHSFDSCLKTKCASSCG